MSRMKMNGNQNNIDDRLIFNLSNIIYVTAHENVYIVIFYFKRVITNNLLILYK